MVVCDAAFWQEVANDNGQAERDRRLHAGHALDRHVASFATTNHFVPALPGGDVGEQIPRIRVDLRQVQLLEM